MRIPRKYIGGQREFLQSLYKIKYIHYRDLHKEIDSTNFQICTKADFKAIDQDPNHKNIRETWGRLKASMNVTYDFTSRTKSQYVMDDQDNVYRLSNHWGAVASCEWTREGEGQLMMSVFDSGDWEIGVANLKDFEVFRRPFDRKRDKILNPEWITQMKTLIPTSEKLYALKHHPDFQELPKEDKQLIGENFGIFRKELSLLDINENNN